MTAFGDQYQLMLDNAGKPYDGTSLWSKELDALERRYFRSGRVDEGDEPDPISYQVANSNFKEAVRSTIEDVAREYIDKQMEGHEHRLRVNQDRLFAEAALAIMKEQFGMDPDSAVKAVTHKMDAIIREVAAVEIQNNLPGLREEMKLVMTQAYVVAAAKAAIEPEILKLVRTEMGERTQQAVKEFLAASFAIDVKMRPLVRRLVT